MRKSGLTRFFHLHKDEDDGEKCKRSDVLFDSVCDCFVTVYTQTQSRSESLHRVDFELTLLALESRPHPFFDLVSPDQKLTLLTTN